MPKVGATFSRLDCLRHFSRRYSQPAKHDNRNRHDYFTRLKIRKRRRAKNPATVVAHQVHQNREQKIGFRFADKAT